MSEKITYICDFCGKESQHAHFIMGKIESEYLADQIPAYQRQTSFGFCRSCMKQINDLLIVPMRSSNHENMR